MDDGPVGRSLDGPAPGVAIQHQVDDLTKMLKEREAEFAQQRKKFIDIYKQKEAESQRYHNEMTRLESDNSRLREELGPLKQLVEDTQSQLAIAMIAKDEELDALRTKHQDELSSLNTSLQTIMEDTERQASTSATAYYEQERKKLVQHIHRQEAELHAFRSTAAAAFSPQQKESDSKATKLKGMHTPPQLDGSGKAVADVNSDQRMRQSARAAVSYEEEIGALRMQIDDAHKKLEQYANDDQIQELQQELKNEKHARRDLEMFVAVLNEQKMVFQNDIDKLRRELREALDLLNKERRSSDGIRLTWQMANDEFLKSHRLLMSDMSRMGSLLTEEQQRCLAELKKKDAEKEQQLRKASAMKLEANHSHREAVPTAARPPSPKPLLDSTPLEAASAAGSAAISSAESLLSSTVTPPSLMLTDDSPCARVSPSAVGASVDDGALGGMRTINVSLTEAQQRALSAPQPEDIENKKLLDSFRSMSDVTAIATGSGKRLVSEKEWEMLQIELQASRTKLGRPCDMCKNYEADLQKEQERLKSLEMALAQAQLNFKNQNKTIAELELQLNSSSKLMRSELEALQTKVDIYEAQLKDMTNQYETELGLLNRRLSEIAHDRELIFVELTQLQQENESLLNAHSKSSQEMQAESISLPDNVEEMERLLLQYREQIISIRAAREHLDGRYASELMLIRDQLTAERQSAKQMEETLAVDISEMQSKLARLASLEAQVCTETDARRELEHKLSILHVDAETKAKFIQGLKVSLIEQTELRKKLEEANGDLKDKVRNLQRDLDSSEVVQRDFVKLSQELQVQLETIRHSQNEVRWQHPEDVEACHSCKKPFPSAKHKNHCKHCGKIFCADCTSKVVHSGSNQRSSRVCDVCHTILVKDATPYFSSPR